jgi:FtsH-binding integral membrane protein
MPAYSWNGVLGRDELMAISEQKLSRVRLATSFGIMAASSALLLWGEAANSLWIFIDGVVVFLLGLWVYYRAGGSRQAFERRYRSLPRWLKFILLVLSCAPWMVLYFFISPLWDAILTTVVVAAGCSTYTFWKRKERPSAGSATAD